VLVQNFLCSNFAIFSGGMQLGSSRREVRTRVGGEGARQEDSGRRHFGLHGVPTTAPEKKVPPTLRLEHTGLWVAPCSLSSRRYAIALAWPADGKLPVRCLSGGHGVVHQVSLLGYDGGSDRVRESCDPAKALIRSPSLQPTQEKTPGSRSLRLWGLSGGGRIRSTPVFLGKHGTF